MKLGIVVGIQAEAKLARHLFPSAIIAKSGATTKGLAKALALLLHNKTDALLSFGLAGGVTPTSKCGTILVPRSIKMREDCFAVHPGLHRWLYMRKPEVLANTLWHSEIIISSAEDKNKIAKAFPEIDGVDMESGSLAEIATNYNVPFAVLRVVCDGPFSSLPRYIVDSAIYDNGDIRYGIVLSRLLCHPSQVISLVKTAIKAYHAMQCLANYTKRLPQFDKTLLQ